MINIHTNRQRLEIVSTGITVIFGPTGVGKTTLLRQIAGHLPLKGSLSLDGETIDSVAKGLKPQERGFAYVSQSSSLVRQFSVSQNLSLATKAAQRPLTAAEISEVYRICRIEHLLARQASQVSGGEAQQICLAMALLSNPRLMLLDEPVSALDMRLKYEVLSQFKLWIERHTIPVLYVSHDVNEIALIADYMAVVSQEKGTEIRSYQAWLADVNSEFVTQNLVVNTLNARFVSSKHGLNLMTLSEAPDISFWAQGEIEHEQDYVVELPITDVSISLEPMPASSILNQLEATIETISKPVNGYQFVSLKLATQAITSRLTSYSINHLALETGMSCYMCFKTPRVLPLRV